MRLLRTDRIQLIEAFGDNVPPYAILSHTWGEGEVLFQDLQHPGLESLTWDTLDDASLQSHLPPAARIALRKAGFKKIQNVARLARRNDHHFIWVDTCCIDKTNSAELLEAVSAMCRYYQKAEVCYAYHGD
ncbi:heterokaryon incompatibility, partial [Podospora australis]